MRKNIGSWILGGVLTLVTNACFAIDPSEVDSVVDRALVAFDVPGAAIGIVIDGKVVLAKGYGVRDVANNLPVSEHTLFAIGSCTKAFTTFALGQLVDEGKISWDDPVIKYLPTFRLNDLHATHHVTIRDLVTHRSGLPRHDLAWYGSQSSRAELIKSLEYLEPVHDLREKFYYNNFMYAVAGVVIEQVTGLSWEEVIKSRIFTVLGMDDSNTSVEDSQKSDDFSLPYCTKNKTIQKIPFRAISSMGPAGSINASILDMTHWLEVQLSGGVFQGVSLIKKNTLQEMHSLQMAFSTFPVDLVYNTGYGLGWMVGMHKGHYLVSHGGGIDGFISNVALLPQEKMGVVILTNNGTRGGAFVSSLTKAIFDKLLKVESEDWIDQEQKILEEVEASLLKGKEENTTSSSEVPFPSDYVGQYEHPGYGLIQVFLKGNTLKVKFNSWVMKLNHKTHDLFTLVSEDIATEDLGFSGSFLRNFSGDIVELQIPFEASVAPIRFIRKVSNELLSVDYLKQFEGVFEGEGISVEIALRGPLLVATFKGGGSVELSPNKLFQFTLKGIVGSHICFIADTNGKFSEFVLTQPNIVMSFKSK